MPKYVVYEVWTKSRVVDIVEGLDVYSATDPDIAPVKLCGMSLCNWHVVPVEADALPKET